MNAVTITGVVAGWELRKIESGRDLLNLDIHVDGRCLGESPSIHCAYFPKNGDVREIKAGKRVLIFGALRHRRDVGGLFVTVNELFVFPEA